MAKRQPADPSKPKPKQKSKPTAAKAKVPSAPAEESCDPPPLSRAEFRQRCQQAEATEPAGLPPTKADTKAHAKATQFVREVTASGTLVRYDATSMGRPVMLPPSTEEAILNNILCREELDPTGPPLELSPTTDNFFATVKAFSSGSNVPNKSDIERVTASLPEKVEISLAFASQSDIEQLPYAKAAQMKSIVRLNRAADRNDLTVGDNIVIWRIANAAEERIRANLEKVKPVNGAANVEKIDQRKLDAKQAAERYWEGTTPQGREIIRKTIWKRQQEREAAHGNLPEDPFAAPVEPPEEPPVDSVIDQTVPAPEVTLAHPLPAAKDSGS